MSISAYRLVRRERPVARAPELDERQRRVVDHKGGPLLVLAGPGTGKTTTLVETVVDRIEVRGVDPGRILVLTFSRKAAQELRERITGRLHRTTREPTAMTFHSYAYALIRREFQFAGEPQPRLLSGPEQLMELREFLAGELADGAQHWPERLRPALHTRGFAEELRDFLMRAQERGLDPEALRYYGHEHRREDWIAVADFLDRYTGRFDIAPVAALNYAELVRVAANLLTDPEVRAREQSAREIVLVDEYQDTDPAQEELLRALAGDGRELIVVGDPDQSIYGFRGADVRGILEFPQRFPEPVTGEPCPVVALGTCRRSGPELLAASRAFAARLPAAPSPDGAPSNSHRALAPLPDSDAGECRVLLTESPSQEAALIADTLRRAHLIDGVPWSDMAVLVRSATRQVPTLRRALTAAGVPVAVGGDEMVLSEEPLVRSLLLLLRCGLHPENLDEAAAHELLTGPLGGADPLRVRRLGRALRQLELDTGGRRRAAVLLAEALSDPRNLTMVAEEVRSPAERVSALLRIVSGRAASASAEAVLWEVWQTSGLADKLLAASQVGGRRGAAADRDLDAAVALFEAAARYCDRLPPGAPEGFLEDLAAQEIPGDTLAEHAPRDAAVRILTAHRSKGLEWELVAVAGVQEGHWPDTRLRGSLLGVEHLVDAASGYGGTSGAAVASRLLDEERRLFYVALTRARRRLLITAVGGEDLDTEERPSRFLAELGLGAPESVAAGRRSLSLPALVADLRSAATDPECPEPLRRAAAAHLARLSAEAVRGADPSQWYALTPISDDRPLVLESERIRVSPSQVEKFTTCRLRWLLESAVGAEAGSDQLAAGLGSIIHAVAVLLAEGTELADVDRRLDEIWTEMEFGAPWYARKERERAEDMVRKLADWHDTSSRELVAWEEGFRVEVGDIEITGRVDRLERDGDGRAVVIDIKTGSSKPGAEELARHPQLGVYQLAVVNAAFAKFQLTEPGGAELIQAGKASLTAKVREQAQPPLAEDPDPAWPERLVRTVASGMSGGTFAATRNDGCRTCPVRSSCPAHEEGGRT